MAEDFWKPVFERLLQNHDFISLLISDTSENDLVSWVKPNPALSLRCARFLQKGRITDRAGFEKAFAEYAAGSLPLKQIILFTWVEKNPLPMSIPTRPLTDETRSGIENKEFGSFNKIRLMSYIDPRESAADFYRQFIARHYPEPQPQSVSMPAAAKSDGSPNQNSTDSQSCSNLLSRIAELEAAMDVLKTRIASCAKVLKQEPEKPSLSQNGREPG
jgi:hypothetical protein